MAARAGTSRSLPPSWGCENYPAYAPFALSLSKGEPVSGRVLVPSRRMDGHNLDSRGE